MGFTCQHVSDGHYLRLCHVPSLFRYSQHRTPPRPVCLTPSCVRSASTRPPPPQPPPAGRRSPESLEGERAFDCPGPYPTSRVPCPLTALEQELQGAQRVSRSIIVLVAGLALLHSAAHAHDRWDSGEPVPAWVKTERCGPSPSSALRSGQAHAAGDVVDIYPDPIPAHIALPSQDDDYWLFLYNDYGFYGSVRCFFVPALF